MCCCFLLYVCLALCRYLLYTWTWKQATFVQIVDVVCLCHFNDMRYLTSHWMAVCLHNYYHHGGNFRMFFFSSWNAVSDSLFFTFFSSFSLQRKKTNWLYLGQTKNKKKYYNYQAHIEVVEKSMWIEETKLLPISNGPSMWYAIGTKQRANPKSSLNSRTMAGILHSRRKKVMIQSNCV